MMPISIETAPKPELDHESVPVLLYCPDRGGWHRGVWWMGSWHLYGHLDTVLRPTHWLPVPPDATERGGDEWHF